jgi:hypothetical protein
MLLRSTPLILLLAALPAISATVLIRTVDGKQVEGETAARFKLQHAASTTDVRLEEVLSVHTAHAASAAESAKIEAGITAIQGADRKARDQAVEALTNIGLPVMTPLLKAYKDTDQHEPRPLYRLFERIIPSYADEPDRSLSLVRMKSGDALRGQISGGAIEVRTASGKESIEWSAVRTLAVKQRSVRRSIQVHSLKHSQQIEYLDTGVVLTAASKVDSTARGFSRLSWNGDDWATDPDGLKKPAANYKTHLFDGQPFGALIGRSGATGDVFLVGKKMAKTGLPAGRLQLAVNDNRHWQNNLGTYSVTMTVTEAYDVGDAQ